MLKNKYNNVEIDVEALFEPQKISLSAQPSGHSADNLSIFERYFFFPLRFKFYRFFKKTGMYDKLIIANIVTDWFEDFKKYWVYILGNRPIDLHDFYYLRCEYRKKFQSVEYKKELSHVEAWQQDAVIYFLFHSYYRSIFRDFAEFLPFIRKGNRVLEYGCGIAPCTNFLSHFLPHYNISFTIADIKTLHFHFAINRFENYSFVNSFVIDPEVINGLQGEYDLIFCIECFEHVLHPTELVRHFHTILRPGGVLIFDFIKSDAKGLDTVSALKERDKVLDFVEEKFEIIRGSLVNREDFGTIICRKL